MTTAGKRTNGEQRAHTEIRNEKAEREWQKYVHILMRERHIFRVEKGQKNNNFTIHHISQYAKRTMKKAPKYTLVPTHNWKAQKLNVVSGKTIIYKRPERRLQRTATVFQLHSCFLYENKSCSFPDQALNFHTIYIEKQRECGFLKTKRAV